VHWLPTEPSGLRDGIIFGWRTHFTFCSVAGTRTLHTSNDDDLKGPHRPRPQNRGQLQDKGTTACPDFADSEEAIFTAPQAKPEIPWPAGPRARAIPSAAAIP